MQNVGVLSLKNGVDNVHLDLSVSGIRSKFSKTTALHRNYLVSVWI